MKKMYVFLGLVLSVVMLPTAVLATENVVDVDSKETLTSCVSTTGNTCKLTSNIVLESVLEINDGKEVTIELNGKSITPADTLTVSGGMIVVHNGGKLVVNDSVGTGKINSGVSDKIFGAIQVTKKGDTSEKTASLVVNSGTIEGYYYALVGNGTRHNTDIIVNGGTLRGLNEDSVAIYHPQNGKLTINNGTLVGGTGIEMRAGHLIINGGTVTGNYKPLETAPNGNGSTTSGAAVAVVQHTTKLDLKVEINGGTLKAFIPFMEANLEKNDSASIAKVVLSIKGGTFEIINEGEDAIYSEDVTGFITGGTFSKDISSSYLGANIVKKLLGTKYVAGKENSIELGTVTNGTLAADKTKAIVGEKVKLTITPAKDYEVSSIKVLDASDEEVTVTNNEFVMPNSEVEVVVTITKTVVNASLPVLDPTDEVTKVTVGVKEADKNEEVLLESLKEDASFEDALETSSLNVEIEVEEIDAEDIDEDLVAAMKAKAGKATVATYFDITLAVKDTSNTKVGELTELTDKIELMILLPESLRNTDKDVTRSYYILRSHNNVTELIEAKLSEDGKYLLFESDRFSTYALAYEDAANPKTLDNISTYTILGSIALIGLLGFALYTKKHKYNM